MLPIRGHTLLLDLRQKVESVDVVRTYNCEVPVVQRRDMTRSVPLGHRDNRGVDGSKREIAVGGDKLRYPHPVTRVNRLRK